MKKIIRIIIEGICIISLVFVYAHIAKTHNIYDSDIDPSQYGSGRYAALYAGGVQPV